MKHWPLIAAVSLVAAPAAAVGLGPLVKDGVTDGPRKAFYLTVSNPYSDARIFRAYATGLEDEIDGQPVDVIPNVMSIGGGESRKIIVVANDLQPGQQVAFRVCAELKERMKGTIHARVCSKLSARRMARAA